MDNTPPHQTARIMRPLAGAFMRANDYSPLLPRGFAPIIRRPGVTPRAIVHRAYSPDRGTPIYSWNHSAHRIIRPFGAYQTT